MTVRHERTQTDAGYDSCQQPDTIELLKKDKKLIISVEIGLACNMRCPYCYQGTDKVNKSKLSDDDINYLLKYY